MSQDGLFDRFADGKDAEDLACATLVRSVAEDGEGLPPAFDFG